MLISYRAELKGRSCNRGVFVGIYGGVGGDMYIMGISTTDVRNTVLMSLKTGATYNNDTAVYFCIFVHY